MDIIPFKSVIKSGGLPITYKVHNPRHPSKWDWTTVEV